MRRKLKKAKKITIFSILALPIFSFAICSSFVYLNKNTSDANKLEVKNRSERNTSKYISNISCDIFSSSVDSTKYYKEYNFSNVGSANVNIAYNDNSKTIVSKSSSMNLFDNGQNFSFCLPTVELAREIKLNIKLDLELIWKEYNAIIDQQSDLHGGSQNYTSPYNNSLSSDFNNFNFSNSSVRNETVKMSEINSTSKNWNESDDGELTNITTLNFDYQYLRSDLGVYDNKFLLKNMQAVTTTTRINNQTTKYGYVYFNDKISNFKLNIKVPDATYLIRFVNNLLKNINIQVTQDFYTLQKDQKLAVIQEAMNEYVNSNDFRAFLTSQKIYINDAYTIRVISNDNINYSFALDFGQPDLQYTQFTNLESPEPTPTSISLDNLTGYTNTILTENYFLSNKTKIESDINNLLKNYSPNNELILNTTSRIEPLTVENIDTKNGKIITNLIVNKYVNEEGVLINTEKSIPLSISGFKPCDTKTYINQNLIVIDVSQNYSNILASSFSSEQLKRLLMGNTNFIRWNYDTNLNLTAPTITNMTCDIDNTIGELNIYNITFNGLYNDKGSKIDTDDSKDVKIKLTGFKTIQPTPKLIEYEPNQFTNQLNFTEDVSDIELSIDLLNNKKELIDNFLRNSGFAKSLPDQNNPIPSIIIQANIKEGQIIAEMYLASYYDSKGIPKSFDTTQIYGKTKAIFNGFKKVDKITEDVNDTKVEISEVVTKQKDYKWLWIGLCVGIPILIILVIILSIVFVSVNNNKKLKKSEQVIKRIRQGEFVQPNRLSRLVNNNLAHSNNNKKQLTTKNNSRKSLPYNQKNNKK